MAKPKELKSEEMLCGICIYWKRQHEKADRGHCDRFPPIIRGSDGLNKHGLTHENCSCGEFVDSGRRIENEEKL